MMTVTVFARINPISPFDGGILPIAGTRYHAPLAAGWNAPGVIGDRQTFGGEVGNGLSIGQSYGRGSPPIG
jgi:hypothetical protein